LTLSNTSSFLTRSVQLIFSILLQHHRNIIKHVFGKLTVLLKQIVLLRFKQFVN
jgi:hypothetical protein